MSAEKLAFLQNFYTDVTLYVPAEPEPTAAVTLTPTQRPNAAVPTPAPIAARPAVAAPPAPDRSAAFSQPSRSYSKPSAGLERLASGYVPPLAPAEKADLPSLTPSQAAPAPSVATPKAPVAPVPPATPPVPAVPPVMLTPFSTLGDNAQGVILLFRLPPEQFLKLHRNVFLTKMLQALDFVMADVVLVNVESELPVALVNLRQKMAATHIIAFGKNLLDTTIRNTQIYEPVQFPSLGLSYLSSATVDLVEYDVSLKKRLWPGLQRMFGKA